MRRPPVHEWAVLDEDGDAVPGDPDAITLLGLTLKDTADDIWREAGEIKALASVDAWKSKAADRFRDVAGDTEAAAQHIHRAISHDGLHDSRWDKVRHSVGDALSDVGHFAEDVGETVLSDLASLGNAMAHDAGAVAEVLGGIGLATLGAGGEIGGLALDATGIGALLGVPAGVVSAGAIAGGLSMAGLGLSTIVSDAAGPDRVTMSSDGSGGGGGGDWSTATENDSVPASEEDRAAYTQRKQDLSGLSKNKQVAEVKKGVEVDGQKYKPEGALLRGAKHGIDWNERSSAGDHKW